MAAELIIAAEADQDIADAYAWYEGCARVWVRSS